MEILNVEQMAKKWGISPRTVQNLCKNGRIPGAVYFGKSWMIPADAERPQDGCRKAVECPDPEISLWFGKVHFCT